MAIKVGGEVKAHLDSIDSNLSTAFNRTLEYFEAEATRVEYGELKSWKHIPISNDGGDNKWYTWTLADKVGSWKIGTGGDDDIPEINIMSAELAVPIRTLVGGYRYTLSELLAGRQAAANGRGGMLQIDQEKMTATQDAYKSYIDEIAWFANPASAKYAGLTGLFYNPYIPTISAAAGGTTSKTTWFSSTGVAQKSVDEVLADLDGLCTMVRVNTADRHAINSILMPIKHFTYLSTTRIPDSGGLTILKFFLQNHPEITTIDTLVPALNVPAGGSLTVATDVILGYVKDPSVVKLVLPRMFNQLPVQMRGMNFVVPCWATTAAIITKKPLAMGMLTGTSANGLGS